LVDFETASGITPRQHHVRPPMELDVSLELGVWNLEFLWSLEATLATTVGVGIWSFDSHAARCRYPHTTNGTL
jgi:hypothetical protein